ncbi:MAG: hypothetical protein FD143_3456 [Ignavibacteria bacterium]|nr:MAG: hypothetical protein FD143_3456 [Ignavibacteria bacterium]
MPDGRIGDAVLMREQVDAPAELIPLIIQNILLPTTLYGPNINNLILEIFDHFISSHITAPNPAHTKILIFINRATLACNISQIMQPLDHVFISPNDILAIVLYSLSSLGITIV